MLHFYKDGDTVKQGFNFYRLSDTQNRGFKLRIGDTMWQLRYRIFGEYWITKKLTITKEDRLKYDEFVKEFGASRDSSDLTMESVLQDGK